MLSSTRTIIVDEIHALAPNKRGSHLAISLERLAALVPHPLLRIGLSATQKPIEEVARFLVGANDKGEAGAECTIVDTGHTRQRDLAIEIPPAPLESVMSNETWSLVYDRLVQLIEGHRTTLVFVNTRRLVERVSRQLADRLGEVHVGAHHGSLSKEKRFDAEQRLKYGKLKALVATASLELGIDIGDVDLVCQIGSPRGIATFLQRVGRSGHAVDGTPKGRLFPLSRDELVESTALLDSVNRGELDRLKVPSRPARCAVAADRGGDRRTRDQRRRDVCAYPPRLALSRARTQGFRRGRDDAGRRLHHAARTSWRAGSIMMV
jgi:ATP-dependent Lhr-like helicase